MATVIPSTFRKISGVNYTRERITTTDDDFLDLDWLAHGSDKLIVISHGLEGNSNRPYVKGMAKYFARHDWDVVAWNCRSCSGEANHRARLYHHGETDDLAEVIKHAIEKFNYRKVVLIGFSMGGSMTLKYLGERAASICPQVKGGVAFSVPVNLASSVNELGKKENDFYRRRFLKKLEKKIKEKSIMHPDKIKFTDFKQIQYFPEFDNLYTAPLHGFKNAEHFYLCASADQYMLNTQVPTLLMNAVNDPFLAKECYPYETCRDNKYLYFEAPEYGGHVGFTLKGSKYNYMERRALEFVEEHTEKVSMLNKIKSEINSKDIYGNVGDPFD